MTHALATMARIDQGSGGESSGMADVEGLGFRD